MATTKKTAAKKSTGPGFTADEKAAMKAHAAELKASSRAKDKAATEAQALLDAIAAMPPQDRKLASAVHRVVTDAAPGLLPKTWYGMPAYTNADGKVVCWFKPSSKFKMRYSMLGFEDAAQLDDGTMWLAAFAITELTEADEKKLATVLKKAAG
jgi:uncharacterized protein YdhG (YjbR/CyaY superfamily)